MSEAHYVAYHLRDDEDKILYVKAKEKLTRNDVVEHSGTQKDCRQYVVRENAKRSVKLLP
jgi:hypothetical protein